MNHLKVPSWLVHSDVIQVQHPVTALTNFAISLSLKDISAHSLNPESDADLSRSFLAKEFQAIRSRGLFPCLRRIKFLPNHWLARELPPSSRTPFNMFLLNIRRLWQDEKITHDFGWRKSMAPVIDDNNFRWDSGVVLDVGEIQTFVDAFDAGVSEQLDGLSL